MTRFAFAEMAGGLGARGELARPISVDLDADRKMDPRPSPVSWIACRLENSIDINELVCGNEALNQDSH